MNTEKEQKEIEEKWQTERLEKQINFIREMDKEKFIGRQTYLSDGKRKENDAEHAWHLALMTLLLSEYANEKIDTLKTMTMVLFHDVVEIDAGDTYAYDEEGKKTQAQREQKAAERLYGLLPEDQGAKLKAIWEEFEAKNTPESRFSPTHFILRKSYIKGKENKFGFIFCLWLHKSGTYTYKGKTHISFD